MKADIKLTERPFATNTQLLADFELHESLERGIQLLLAYKF